MRAPVQWLADYVDIEMTTDELAHRLTMAGLKVEAVDRVGAGWDDVHIGQVVELAPHPTSNKPLLVTRVDLGDRTVRVVTGAQNVKLHDKVALVPVGGVLPCGPDGGPMVIQRRPMAGITSEGMLASERELGLSDEHSGILILPPDAPVGELLRSVMAGDVLDVETNPNRPDTLSIVGIAREVAALTGQQVSLPDLDAVGDTITWLDDESIPVTVEAADLCPRYSALRIEGVRTVPSPLWLTSRLEAAGMRSISLLVDITNYVMLEFGQPMHAFDASVLAGGEIVVRRAREGERVRTLDGVERALSPENLVIADAERVVAIAGVMGGENSEITDVTSAIVLESATFNPVSVRRTAHGLGLRTESSARFEKGLPVETTIIGIKRYLQLLQQITDAPLRVARVSDVLVDPPPQRIVTMPVRDLHRLSGLRTSPEEAGEALSLLGFDVDVGDDAVRAGVPYWRRVDIERSADLVEEVVRIVGYDTIPVTLPRSTMAPAPLLPELELEDVVRRQLIGYGVNEALTHSLTSAESMARLRGGGAGRTPSSDRWDSLVPNAAGVLARGATVAPVEIANPATRDRNAVRLTLLPSLLDVIARNIRHTEERLAFFEIARTIFRRDDELPYERRTLAIALSGVRRPRTWNDPEPGLYTFYDLKGMLEGVLGALQVTGWDTVQAPHPALHPGRSAVLRAGDVDLAYLGELHPDVQAAFDIDEAVQMAEVDLDAVFERASMEHTFHPLPRHPAAYRDIAVIVDADVPAGEAFRDVKEAGGDLLESARIFDVYTGDPLPRGKKSLAFGLTFREPGATLMQDEVTAATERIVSTLSHTLGAALRE